MHITRLRLLGFKSFVEPTELLIEPGLTGVVGPNGCGKSNLLEALRWVMGETSYKSMRGSGMDDVIFAGTDLRPGRNSAEVTITIDNGRRTAPAAFNDGDVLEISRRIQREAGSVYKINGKDVRARDVQLLFADAATGARSQALVQQGRIGEIVNAKPQDRRRILEDAAGIAGLHGRRHEAELRLKAAESNLERLGDVMGQIGAQLQNLRRQARQAQRYRELSDALRKAEAIQHHLSWTAAVEAVEAEEAALLEATRLVGQYTQAESSALRTQSDIAEQLQPLRDEEAARAAVLHRLEVERDTLEREEARARERQSELETRLVQLREDIARETDALAEARELLDKLAAEEQGLGSGEEDQGTARAEARAVADEALAALGEAETLLHSATAETAELRAKRRQTEAQIAEAAARGERLAAQFADLERQIAALEPQSGAREEVAALGEEAERLAGELAMIEDQTLAAEEALTEASGRERESRDLAAQARLRARQLETEVATLVKVLKPTDADRWRPVVDDINVAAGYEIALGAALGDDLDVSVNEAAPVRWSRVPAADDDPPLPEGAEPLNGFVSAPLELARRLSQIGVVSRADGERLKGALKPGQRLVSREGDLWRWDGFTATADAPTAAAQRLAERNRLDQLEREVEAVRAAADDAEQQRDAAQEAVAKAQTEDKRLRDLWRHTQARATQARDRQSRADKAIQELGTRLAALTEALKRTRQSLDEAAEQKALAEQIIDGLPPADEGEAACERHKAEVAARRMRYTDAKAALDGVEREMRLRQGRLQAIASERERWANRARGAEAQIATLEERLEDVQSELVTLAELPAQVAERRQALLGRLARAEAERRGAADRLAEAESILRDGDRALREAQAHLSQAREQRARIEARLEAARERRKDQARLIRDHLDCPPEQCLAAAGLEADATLPDAEQVETRIVKLKADRERLGGVNLRAEEEANALATEFESLEKERSDLEQAIARLRQGIANLNKEGRKRLLDAFDTVNAQFQRLFKVLFAGGEAELQLIESDDPLQSGLEILARPPGKKPQVLTLLSGGEKALTALALIFAVFLTNPSPICVLDEVDAPLDDANVHRFCAMMEEMARSTETRFLVITHHPMTMARMNRLFGVTMAEKGISQLVSVDLQTAERFREAS